MEGYSIQYAVTKYASKKEARARLYCLQSSPADLSDAAVALLERRTPAVGTPPGERFEMSAGVIIVGSLCGHSQRLQVRRLRLEY